MSLARGLSSSNGSWRGSPQCARCSSCALLTLETHLMTPELIQNIKRILQWYILLQRVQMLHYDIAEKKFFMKEQFLGSPFCSPSVQLRACHSEARVICSHYSAAILSLLFALCSSSSVSSSRVFMSCLWLLSIDSSQAHFVDCVLMVRSCSYELQG